jgi:mRNA interferase MazF
LVDLNPRREQENPKTRPVVIISAEIFNPIPLSIVIPIASWQKKFGDRLFMVKIEATPENQLRRNSARNVQQVRSIQISQSLRQSRLNRQHRFL